MTRSESNTEPKPAPAADVPLDDARQLVKREREHIIDKLTAFDRFIRGVHRLPTDPWPQSASASAAASARGGPLELGAIAIDDTPTDDRTRQVRELFAETVRPLSIEDTDEPEPLLVTIQEELGAEIALALSPSTTKSFTPELRGAIESAVEQCRGELRAMERGLDTEADSLRAAADLQASIADRIETDREPLSTLGFEALSRRHERLDGFRQHCEELAADRQSTLQETTAHGTAASLSQWDLVEYLYQPLSVDYPVLAAVARLSACCERRQRTIRSHLTRCG
ncbi:MAG: DUF7260 family protein [Halohasta sp.]